MRIRIQSSLQTSFFFFFGADFLGLIFPLPYWIRIRNTGTGIQIYYRYRFRGLEE
jgi:hypothetical protein